MDEYLVKLSISLGRLKAMIESLESELENATKILDHAENFSLLYDSSKSIISKEDYD